MQNPQQQGLNIDFKNTTAIEGFDEVNYLVKPLF